MQIADLFINIGLKGGGAALKGLGSIETGLSNVASTSLATKAGILGVIYAAERLATDSVSYGLSLQQYGNVTQQNIEVLERWQKALRNTGVTSEDTAQSFWNLFGIVGKISLGGAAPQGMGFLMREGLDINKAAADADYYMKFLKEFWTKKIPDLNQAAKAELMHALGVSNPILSGFNDSRMLNPDKLNPDFTKKQVKALAGLSSEMENIRARIRRDSGILSVEWGGSAITDINAAVTGIERLIKAIDSLASRKGVSKGVELELMAIASVGLTLGPVAAAITAIVVGLTELEKHKEVKDGFWGKINQVIDDIKYDPSMDHLKKDRDKMGGLMNPNLMGPQLPPGSVIINNNINQSIQHNGDAKDTHAVVDSHKKGIETAFNLLSAKYQVT